MHFFVFNHVGYSCIKLLTVGDFHHNLRELMKPEFKNLEFY
jgi:hypothetical protein